jgi:tight adherence protein B
MSPLIVSLAVGVVAYIVFMIAVPSAARDEKSENIQNALDRLYEENRSNENSTDNVLRAQLKEESAGIRTIFQLPFMRPVYEAGVQAGYQSNLQHLVFLMAIGGAGALVLVLALGLSPMAYLLVPLLAWYAPYFMCKRALKKRNRQFIDQFPDALDMVVRSVRSGFPLSAALQMLADNAEEPMKEEFRKVVDDIALGRSLSQSLARLAARINEPDVRFFVVVLSVQQETGGNLSEIVGNLSGIIRKRKQLRHRIKALTSEGKATGLILGALPVLVGGALLFIAPDYIRPLYADPTGKMIGLGVIALLVTCFFVVKAMINVDI